VSTTKAFTAAGKVSEREDLVAWIERELGGDVERCERYGRWRPAWDVDVRRDGQVIPLHVRGARKENLVPWPLEYEAEIMKFLERASLPVPHIYGVCEQPHAIVMDRVAGRANLVNAQNDGERDSVKQHMAEIIAVMHQLDIQPLVDVGMDRPNTSEEVAFSLHRYCDAMYTQTKAAPDPRVEFARSWIRRHIPKRGTEVCFTQVDSGQFLFEDGRITALLDFELACLGDPAADLAALRARAVYEPMGDLRPVFERYRELTGGLPDLELLGFYSVVWEITTALLATPALTYAGPYSDHVRHISWYVSSVRMAMVDIAEIEGVDIPPIEPLIESASPWSDVFSLADQRLATQLPDDGSEDSHFENTVTRNMLRYAESMDKYRSATERGYLDDLRRLLGLDCATWGEADRELEGFIVEAGPEHDAALVTIFARWAFREAVLLEGIIDDVPVLSTPLQPLHELAS
jgi:hypothetical protein